MACYKIKPKYIEAIQYTEDNYDEIIDFIGQDVIRPEEFIVGNYFIRSKDGYSSINKKYFEDKYELVEV